MTELTLSFLPLTDAAPIIVAHARGYFLKQGIQSTLRRESSWTALRDSVNSGAAQAAQMLYSMPIASACGMLGFRQKPLVVPWVLSRNGQGITLNTRYQGSVTTDARAIRTAAIEHRDAGRPLVFAHTLRVGTHAMWLRYWLAAGGIDPVNDVALITIPPPQMVANMRTARLDGFCVGEPWNARALAEDLGFTAVTSHKIWPDHPEKVCAFTEEYAAENPETVIAALRALHAASLWLEEPENLDEAAGILGQPEHLNCAADLIRSRLGTSIDSSNATAGASNLSATFANNTTNRPRPSHAKWFLSQLRRWGLFFGTPDYEGVASRVIRTDLYEAALDGAACDDGAREDVCETLCDGTVFDPVDPEGYAHGFAIKSLQG